MRELYTNWYNVIIKNPPKISGLDLELGSGGGFLKELASDFMTSDVMKVPGVDKVIDASTLPFCSRSIRAIVGTNVLNRVSEIRKFFKEANRVLRTGGRLIFIEPWPKFFSISIYRYLLHKPFDMKRDWGIPFGGPLTSANGALPWIIFSRDRKNFEKDYPRLRIIKIKPFMPLSYIVSGAIERRWPLPRWVFPLVRFLETPFDLLGLFALIVVEKTEG